GFDRLERQSGRHPDRCRRQLIPAAAVMMEFARSEVEGYNRAEQPPEWLGHVAKPLHPRREAGRTDHGVDEEHERAERHHRSGQAIEPVYESVEPATDRAGEFLAELGDHPVETLLLASFAFGTVADEDFRHAADRLTDPAGGGAEAEDPSDHVQPS